MDSLIKKLIEADISMNIVEFGAGCPVTNYIMGMDNVDRKVITSSKMINSEYMTAVKYGLSLEEDIIPKTMGVNYNVSLALEKVFEEEYYSNQCEMNDTFMAVAVGSSNKPYLPFAIYHKYNERARFYYFIMLKGLALTHGRDEIIGSIGGHIALYKDQDVPDVHFKFQNKTLIRAVKEYESREVATSTRE